MEGLVKLDLVLDACRLAVASAYVQGEKPVSILLVAPPEHAKSTLLGLFNGCSSVYYTSDFSTFVLNEFVEVYPRKRTIIIPDLLRITERRSATSKNVISLLSALIEDGWSGKLPLGRVVEQRIIANVLTSVTRTVFYDKRWWWAKMGFLSRFIPITYSYNQETENEIFRWIAERKYRFLTPILDDLEMTEISFPSQFGEILSCYSKIVANRLNNILLVNPVSGKRHVFSFSIDEVKGFRYQKSLQTLAMASALLNGRREVNQEDVDRVVRITELINFDFKPL